jgi:hypothetical protein
VEETLERLAFDLSVRALERQERVVEELRARTGTLLAAGALVASLLGIRASGILALAGGAAAVTTICVSLSILLPNRRLEFTSSGTAFLEHLTRLAAGVGEAHRTLAYWNASAWEANQRVVSRLTARFEVACLSLVVAIVSWSLNVALH